MRIFQDVRDVAFDDAACQPFGDGGLAHASFTHQQRVVLAATAQRLDHALQFHVASDQRIDLAGQRMCIEIQRVILERAFAVLFLLRLIVGCCLVGGRLRFDGFVDAVRDVVHHVEAGDGALVEEIHRMRFFLTEQGHQNIGAGHFFFVGGLHMQDGALDDALEADGGLRIHFAGPGTTGVCVSICCASTARNSSMSAPQARSTCAAEGLSSIASSRCSTVMNS